MKQQKVKWGFVFVGLWLVSLLVIANLQPNHPIKNWLLERILLQSGIFNDTDYTNHHSQSIEESPEVIQTVGKIRISLLDNKNRIEFACYLDQQKQKRIETGGYIKPNDSLYFAFIDSNQQDNVFAHFCLVIGMSNKKR